MYISFTVTVSINPTWCILFIEMYTCTYCTYVHHPGHVYPFSIYFSALFIWLTTYRNTWLVYRLFTFVLVVLCWYVCFCVSTLRPMKKTSQIPCMCKCSWPIKLKLIIYPQPGSFVLKNVKTQQNWMKNCAQNPASFGSHYHRKVNELCKTCR